MSNSTINIIIIILSVSLTIITFAFETKKNDALTPFGKTALALSILILGFSVYFALENEEENNDRFSANMKRFDTLIYKFDTSYRKADSILTNIDYSTSVQLEIQDTTKKIDSLLYSQVNRQEDDYKKLIYKHRERLKNTFSNINSLYTYLDFQLSGGTDTSFRWREVTDVYFKIRNLIASEHDNIVLNSQPYINRVWKNCDLNLKAMSWSFFGYNRPTISSLWSALYYEITRFTNQISQQINDL